MKECVPKSPCFLDSLMSDRKLEPAATELTDASRRGWVYTSAVSATATLGKSRSVRKSHLIKHKLRLYKLFPS